MSSREKESAFRLWYIVQSRRGPANEDFDENLHSTQDLFVVGGRKWSHHVPLLGTRVGLGVLDEVEACDRIRVVSTSA